MALYALGPLIGPAVGPVAGGFIAQTIGVRYVFVVTAGMFVLAVMQSVFPYSPILQDCAWWLARSAFLSCARHMHLSFVKEERRKEAIPRRLLISILLWTRHRSGDTCG